MFVAGSDHRQPTTDDPRVVGGRRSVVNRQPEMNFRKAVLVRSALRIVLIMMRNQGVCQWYTDAPSIGGDLRFLAPGVSIW
jgi:hypothetical protein